MFNKLKGTILQKKATLFYYSILQLTHNVKNLLRFRKTDIFSSIDIETSTFCNRRCNHCPNSRFERGLLKNNILMKETLFKKIIDELETLKFKGRITFQHYNKPLLDSRLPILVTYARKKLSKSKFIIFTNGDFLDISKYNQFVKAGLNKLILTQHDEKKSKKVKEVFDFLKNHKTKTKLVYRKIKDMSLTNRGGLIKIKKERLVPMCLNPVHSFVIQMDGKLILCCNDYQGAASFGDVNNQSILEIWKNPDYKKIRKELKKQIYSLPICKKCTSKK